MGLRLSTAARDAAANAIVDLIDVGGPGYLRIYSGAQPAGPGTSPSGTLLAEFALSNPAFGAASTGVCTLDITPAVEDTSANATGTAGYFRLLTAAEQAGTGLGVIDGTVTATGGGGDLTLNTVSIVSGATVTVTSGTITMPAS